jgi:hypothetical protein
VELEVMVVLELVLHLEHLVLKELLVALAPVAHLVQLDPLGLQVLVVLQVQADLVEQLELAEVHELAVQQVVVEVQVPVEQLVLMEPLEHQDLMVTDMLHSHLIHLHYVVQVH